MMSRSDMERQLADIERRIIGFKRIMRAAHKPWTDQERASVQSLKDDAKRIRRDIADRFGLNGQMPAGRI